MLLTVISSLILSQAPIPEYGDPGIYVNEVRQARIASVAPSRRTRELVSLQRVRRGMWEQLVTVEPVAAPSTFVVPLLDARVPLTSRWHR